MIENVNVKRLTGDKRITYTKLIKQKPPIFGRNITVSIDKEMIEQLRQILHSFIECKNNSFIPNDIYTYQVPASYYDIICESTDLFPNSSLYDLKTAIITIKKTIINALWNVANSYESSGECPDDCYVDINGIKYVYLNFVPGYDCKSGKLNYPNKMYSGTGILINILENSFVGNITFGLPHGFPYYSLPFAFTVNAPIGYKVENGIMKYDDPYKKTASYLKRLFSQNGINLSYHSKLFTARGKDDNHNDFTLPGFRIEVFLPIN